MKELARSYLTITKDLTRVMSRLKAIYRSWAIPCASKQVYAPRHRAEWLEKITTAGVRRRAELYYQQLDALRFFHQQPRKELLAEGRKHSATKFLWTTGGNPVRVYVAGKPGKTVLLKSECDVCARDPVCRRGMARCCLCVRGGPRGCAEDHILPACLLVNCWHAL